jgi:hypothetical protein
MVFTEPVLVGSVFINLICFFSEFRRKNFEGKQTKVIENGIESFGSVFDVSLSLFVICLSASLLNIISLLAGGK